MDASERRREFLRQMSPWFGFVAAAAGIVLGIRAIGAGYAGAGAVGYVAGVLDLAAGYVAGRRGWDRRLDAVFVGSLVAVLVLSVATLAFLELPPSVFEQMTTG